MSEVIHVDFKAKKVKRRQVIGEQAKIEPFKATKDPFVKDFTKLVCEVAQDAHDEGVDHTRMAIVLFDEQKNARWVVWDHSMVTMPEMIVALDECRNRLIELATVTDGGDGCA